MKQLLASCFRVLLVGTLLFGGGSLQAQTFIFNGPGFWNDASKWWPSYPGDNLQLGYQIIINGTCYLDGQYISTHFGSQTFVYGTMTTLFNHGRWQMIGGQLIINISGAVHTDVDGLRFASGPTVEIYNHGLFTVAQGTATFIHSFVQNSSTGTIGNSGILSIGSNGGVLQSQGYIQNADTGIFLVAGSFSQSAGLTHNNGDWRLLDSGTQDIGSTAHFVNNFSTSVLDLGSDNFVVSPGGLLTNVGTIKALSGGTGRLTLHGTLNNNVPGTIGGPGLSLTVGTGTLDNASQLHLQAALNSTGQGTILVRNYTGSFTYEASFFPASGALHLQLEAFSTFNAVNPWPLHSGHQLSNHQTLFAPQQVVMGGGTLHNLGTFYCDGTLNGGTVNNHGYVGLTGPATFSNLQFNHLTGAALVVGAHTCTLSANSTLDCHGSITGTGGTIELSGGTLHPRNPITFGNPGELALAVQGAGRLLNSAGNTITLNQGANFSGDARYVAQPGASLIVNGHTLQFGPSASIIHSLNGSLSGTGTLQIRDANFHNHGNINIPNLILIYSSGNFVENFGNITVTTGFGNHRPNVSFFNRAGSTFHLVGNSLPPPPFVTNSRLVFRNQPGANLTFSGNYALPGEVLNDGLLTINSTGRFDALESFSSNGALHNDGVIFGGVFVGININGPLSGSGSFFTAPGATALNGSEVRPGNNGPGTLHFHSPSNTPAMFLSNSTFHCQIHGPGNHQIDRITTSNGIWLPGGHLVVDWGSFQPSPGQSFEIISVSSLVFGTFASVTVPPVNGMNFTVTYTTNSVRINAPLPLPVELLRFQAEPQGTRVQLRWSTATETNSQHFIVEHSADGLRFSTIGQVQAAGNTTTARYYQWLHTNPNSGTNYYRLRQVDADGSEQFSDIVTAQLTERADAPFQAYPNPLVSGPLTVCIRETADPDTRIHIFDAFGQLVHTAAAQPGTNSLLLPHLPAGQYVLRVGNHSQQIIVARP